MARGKTEARVPSYCGLNIERETNQYRVVALAGNPNVGKSTVFNKLTGLKQHTGNWPGKTVANAYGKCKYKDANYIIVDLPGTYSLMANSEEEKIARDFICFSEVDAVVVVADATCLERNLNLLLQTLEITDKAVLCLNLMDEAKKKKISVDIELLSAILGIPVIGTSAREGAGLSQLMRAVEAITNGSLETKPLRVRYNSVIERAISELEPPVESVLHGRINSRWVSIKLLDGDEALLKSVKDCIGYALMEDEKIAQKTAEMRSTLESEGLAPGRLQDEIVTAIVNTCERIREDCVIFEKKSYAKRDRKYDKILTSKLTGIPIMIALLFAIFWITITGANYPSSLLSRALSSLEEPLNSFFAWFSSPEWARGLFVDGMYRTLAWVVSVMLPPMAIFFPLFSLLEDSGYLPRVAFNMDGLFSRAGAHGKQALTMCMGFGCNAAGVIGCRIIDSPRERLIATVTNSFVPCNGRFPALIAIITVFFAGTVGGIFRSLISTLMLTGTILLGVAVTLIVSKLLSNTILRGLPSSFNLELPPYRKPQIGRVIVRSIMNKTIYLLWRAVKVAAPAGMMIWILANIKANDLSLLTHCAGFLDPFARLMGLDGYILLAFILGFPANEIVVPIIIMSYMSAGSLSNFDGLQELHALFVNHGWTRLTAICVILFILMHWPCGTTCQSIKKETQSVKWTIVSFAVPTVMGILVCMLVANLSRLLGLA